MTADKSITTPMVAAITKACEILKALVAVSTSGGTCTSITRRQKPLTTVRANAATTKGTSIDIIKACEVAPSTMTNKINEDKMDSKAARAAFLARLAARTAGGWDGGDGMPSARKDVEKAVSEANKNGIVLVVKNYHSARDLSYAAKEIMGEKVSPRPDIFFDPFTLFVVANILDRDDGPTVVELEEKEED